ncbi:beta-ketoacyl synthase N-terminal-like domain-containing protein (plasmid) [Streptomyces sp. BI20]|uniref:type I polyketide synthase n=1 Tax=Streptomyces sp. BI20 TaxID=3403460 RepID=UPI003C713421
MPVSHDPQSREPLAIVGMSCRFPTDIESPDRFWELLAGGESAVTELPAERWEEFRSDGRVVAALRDAPRAGGFLDDISGFDATFFGVSPREALSLDPQQRMILELCWQALENAGIPPLSLRGSDSAVFIAGNSHDYGDLLMADPVALEPWFVNGCYLFGLANRVSTVLDLRGPSVSADTACAGSLTAVHMACQALWNEETPLALVGGVNVMSGPGLLLALNASGATSADGRSKTFDEAADGYGRGEGGGVLVLKRLSHARRDGDRVLALIRGGGIFHDGTGEGMMAPNGQAQEHMLRSVYARAGIDPRSVDYIEAHGTGTPAGDKAELNALARVFGAGRAADSPLLVGSVKPNIGHLEAAAGVAGLIKTVLALRHETLPPSRLDRLTDVVDWDRNGLRVVTRATPWAADGEPRRAGVSCYGVGGTICHTIVEEAPRQDPAWRHDPHPEPPTAPGPLLVPVSARSHAGLVAQGRALADWLEAHPEAELPAIGRTLALGRSHLSHRAGVLAHTPAELSVALRALAEADAPTTPPDHPDQGAPVVWLFSGHGAQWAGMGRELLAEEPVFAAALDALAPVYREEFGITPREAIEEGVWEDTARVQAMTTAVQIALADLWHHWGVEPAGIIGHSVGEIAAAVVSGALDRQEAARFACRRAKIVGTLVGTGTMAMVDLPFDKARELLSEVADVDAAVSASPSWTVLSGSHEGLETVLGTLEAQGRTVRRVAADVAFHSALVEPGLAGIHAAARDLRPRPPHTVLYSSVTEDPRSPAERGPDYWVDMMRAPVRFAEAVTAALEDGNRIFTELSTHPIVAHSVSETAGERGVEDVTVTRSLRRGAPERTTLLTSAAALFTAGAGLAWDRLHPTGALLDLPAQAWQRRPFWAETRPTGGGVTTAHDPADRTLLGRPGTIHGERPLTTWDTRLDPETRPYPARHLVDDVDVVPAATHLVTFLAAADTDALADVRLDTALVSDLPRQIRVIRDGSFLRLTGRALDDAAPGPWTSHSTTRALPPTPREPAAPTPARHADPAPTGPVRTVGWAEHEKAMTGRGIGGFGFRWRVKDTTVTDTTLSCEVDLSPDPAADPRHAGAWAPLLDAALTVIAPLWPDDRSRMLTRIGHLALTGTAPTRAVLHAERLRHDDEGTVTFRVTATDPAGTRVALLDEVVCAGTTGTDRRPTEPADNLVHVPRLRPLGDRAARAFAQPVVVIGPGAELVTALREADVEAHAAPDLRAASAHTPATILLVADPITPDTTLNGAIDRTANRFLDAVAVNSRAERPAVMWWLTRADDLSHAPLAGMARIVAGEHPEWWGGHLETDGEQPPETLLPLLHLDLRDEPVRVRESGPAVTRLVTPAEPSRAPALCRPDATYLVTGGLGALGLIAARYLAGRGARRIVLVGRTPLPPREDWDGPTDPRDRHRIAAIRELEAAGVTVRVLALDVCDPEAVAGRLTAEALDLPPVRGIVHAAGVVGDALAAQTSKELMHTVLAPKVAGTLALDRAFPPGSVDFLLLFSSSGRYAQVKGQSAYAAGNAFLDAFAAGRPDTVSLAWMTWHGQGMSESNEAGLAEAEARGLGGFDVAEGLAAWDRALGLGEAHTVITRVVDSPARLPITLDLTPTRVDTEDPDSTEGASALTPEGVRDAVLALVAGELRMPAEEIRPERSLVDHGMDSVMTTTLRARVLRRFGVALPPSLTGARLSVATLTAHLVTALVESDDPSPEPGTEAL